MERIFLFKLLYTAQSLYGTRRYTVQEIDSFLQPKVSLRLSLPLVSGPYTESHKSSLTHHAKFYTQFIITLL